MLNIDESKLQKMIVAQAASELSESIDLEEIVKDKIDRRIDRIFSERAETIITETIDAVIKEGFNREYTKADDFGQLTGETTTIKNELRRTVTAFWNQRVDKKSGKPKDNSYNSISRAEYTMLQICAEDFSETMKTHAANVTGALKDGLRNQLATHMDQMLNNLFKVKSLQDQGKVAKPY